MAYFGQAHSVSVQRPDPILGVDGGNDVAGQLGLKDPITMRSKLMVGIAAASLGIATVHNANATSPAPRPAPSAPRAAAPAPAPKAPVLTNQQLTPKPQPQPQIPANLPKPTQPTLVDKVTTGAPVTLKDLKGTNTPPPAVPPAGVTVGKVGSPPPAGPTPHETLDQNSRSYAPPVSGGGVTVTAPLPRN